MTIKDIGPKPQSFDLEHATLENENYRTVVWSGRYLQVTLMSIEVGSDIGLEGHNEIQKWLRRVFLEFREMELRVLLGDLQKSLKIGS